MLSAESTAAKCGSAQINSAAAVLADLQAMAAGLGNAAIVAEAIIMPCASDAEGCAIEPVREPFCRSSIRAPIAFSRRCLPDKSPAIGLEFTPLRPHFWSRSRLQINAAVVTGVIMIFWVSDA